MIKRFTFLLLILFLSSASHAYQQIEFIRETGDYDKKTKQHQLNSARALSLHGEKIYIADTDANRVLVLGMDGKTLSAIGSKGEKVGQFRSPAGIAVDEAGRIYVADTGNHRIQVFDAGGKPVRVFGVKGDGPRQFDSPTGLFVQRGLLYVADTGNSRLQILSADGIFLQQIRVKTKKDEMRAPVAIAADLQNRVYALDRDSNSVRIFDPEGVEVLHFGMSGKGSDGFDEPQGMAVDAMGYIYVADTGNYKLKKFDGQGKLVGSLGSEGSGPGQFREASGLAVAPDGKVFVLDAEKQTLQIFACESEGTPLVPASPRPFVTLAKEVPGQVTAMAWAKRIWALSNDSIVAVGGPAVRPIGSRGSEPAMLKTPRSLALDAAEKLWVVDTGNDRLQKFSFEGNLLQVIGKSGSGEGEFRSPSGIAVGAKGNLYIADTGNKRVQVLNSKGMFLGMFGKAGDQAGQFEEPVDIAVDNRENLYVVDQGNDRISKFDSNGSLIWEKGRTGSQDGEFKDPSNILVTADSEVYVLDAGNARVQVFDSNGTFLRKFGSHGKAPGEFRSPQGMALESGIRLHVGDRGNGRVQVFTLHQTPAVPAELSAEPRANEVQLRWKGNSESYLEHYQVYRSDTATGPFQPVGTATQAFFLDKGLASNKTFFYRLASRAREGNESTPSVPVSATTPKLIPAAPKKVRIEATEKQITLSWLPNLEPYVSHYRVYRTRQLASGFEPVGQADRSLYMDGPLADETLYYYQITAVGKEGDESPASEVLFASTPKPALSAPAVEIAAVEIGEIFASAYKYYESHAAGKVIIRNNTDNAYPRVKLSFAIKEFMDYPTEIEIEQVPAKKQVEVDLKPVFSNKILDVTENTPVQSELVLTYYIAGEPRTVTRNFPVTLYERHAMVWDQKAKLGAFVTPKDPPVSDLSRSVIRNYVDSYPNLPQPVVYARALYNALGVLGLKYIVDPTSPFQEFSEKNGSADYLQYPRDTLARKSGDCDDLSVLFTAMLENIGIGTAFVDVPGHVFILFNTGVRDTDKAVLGFSDELLVSHEGSVWIPVEMTLVGSSFTRAWSKAAEEYRDWLAKGTVEIVHTQKAWELFKPVTLPATEARSAKVPREEIELTFKGELEALGAQRLANLSAEYLERLKKDPRDTGALAQLGILYGENGMYAEALEQFQRILAADKHNSLALNNIGNINFLQERLEDAKIAYEAALRSTPDDRGTMANLSRVLLRLGRKDDAKQVFQRAIEGDPRLVRQYSDLAAGLGIK